MELGICWIPISSSDCLNVNPLSWMYFQPGKSKLTNVLTSSITRMELLSFPSITFPEKQAIESLLARMVYLAITPAIENETIEFRRAHKTKLPDSIIAATARYARIELLTLDKKLAVKLLSVLP